MFEESTTRDLVELARRSFAPIGNDLDATMSVYGPDSVWDMSALGLGVYEGLDAIRGFFEDWASSYEEFEVVPGEILDFGAGVVLVVVRQNARPVGSSGHVEVRYASVSVWVAGVNVRTTNYRDIDEARAAAERLAQERE